MIIRSMATTEVLSRLHLYKVALNHPQTCKAFRISEETNKQMQCTTPYTSMFTETNLTDTITACSIWLNLLSYLQVSVHHSHLMTVHDSLQYLLYAVTKEGKGMQ